MASKQKGITLMSFVVVLVVVGFFALIAMKLFPMYSEFHNLKGTMDEFALQPNAASYTPAQLQADFDRRFNIAYVESVDSRKHLKIVRNPGGRGSQLVVSYEVRKPLIANLDVVGKFDYAVDLTGASSGG
ncbi:DUF4845 domain-containing protein [Arenimonas sp. MALMAid1274]|uniref:DUF4845 domain-containing protein n=1 Tax=Arenimonas sp. MALMAid1274 TaxID=3411630 RepID=UPI003BA283D8